MDSVILRDPFKLDLFHGSISYSRNTHIIKNKNKYRYRCENKNINIIFCPSLWLVPTQPPSLHSSTGHEGRETENKAQGSREKLRSQPRATKLWLEEEQAQPFHLLLPCN